jgi:hypothetical protein
MALVSSRRTARKPLSVHPLVRSLLHVSVLLRRARETRAGDPNARAAWRTVAALSPKMGGAAAVANDVQRGRVR